MPNHSELFTAPGVISFGKGTVNYSFSSCLEFMEQKGRELFGDDFRIYGEDRPIIFKLLIWAVRDQENAQRLNLNLNKGLMLTGPIGSGKTSLMTLLRFFIPPDIRHNMKSCREVSFEFHRNGYEVIRKHSILAYDRSTGGKKPRALCFDDLGTEQNLKYFGNEVNVLGEILLSRYDQFVSDGMLTHLTTNLTAGEIEKFYGSRVRSRMRSMFNLISFEANTKDKRH